MTQTPSPSRHPATPPARPFIPPPLTIPHLPRRPRPPAGRTIAADGFHA